MATLEDYRPGATIKEKKKKKGKKEKKDNTAKLEGALEVMPDCDYRAGVSYTLSGLGSVFDGPYKFKKVTHTFNSSGYTVSADVTRRLSGGAAGDASDGSDVPDEEAAAAEPRRENAQTNAADDESYIKVNKSTGVTSR